MEKRISVVIPNHNGAATIGKCLESVFSSDYGNYEVIVVDDHSDDNSVEIIERFPCKLIRLERRMGASAARNRGGLNSTGDLIFFTDADCILNKDTLEIINNTVDGEAEIVTGGTYAREPYDGGFYNAFQAVFVNYCETKVTNPDYIAAHAMVMNRETFRKSSGFPEVFLPIIEDVEFTHRLRRQGCRLVMKPELEVRHIFNFTLFRSMKNAFAKSKYWTMYSLKNRDGMRDSGCASAELKTNVFIAFLNIILIAGSLITGNMQLFTIVALLLLCNIAVSRRQFRAFYDAGGAMFGAMAAIYYIFVYSVSVGTGAAAGIMNYFIIGKKW